LPPESSATALFGDRAGLAERYAGRLATVGVERGLIGPAEADRIWSRHVANSAALSPLIGMGCRVIDVGSGAGLPGLPLALARPDLDVILLEPMLRRSVFLEETVADLGLEGQVTVVRARAEDAKLTADVVVARAVAPLDRLVGWTRHLFPEGMLLALKGDKAKAEIAAAAASLAKWRLTADILHPAAATVIRVTRQ
jgi:16S rRNA (guanine527-N7)-methyltransferase